MRTFLSGLFARLGPPEGGEAGDDQLLSRFVSSRDEGAFHEIVRRHGAWSTASAGACCETTPTPTTRSRRSFSCSSARRIRPPRQPARQLAVWVAVNVARKGREVLARRTHELVGDVRLKEASSSGELREVIDERTDAPTGRLSLRCRGPISRPHRRKLRASWGGMKGRSRAAWQRARAILADRLSRRGVVVPAVGLGSVNRSSSRPLSPRAAASRPRGSLGTRYRTGEEAMRAMSISKFKTTVAVMAAAGVRWESAPGVAYACGNRPRSSRRRSQRPSRSRIARSDLDQCEKETRGQADGRRTRRGRQARGRERGIAKPARFILKNPSGDITVIPTAMRRLVEFFRRQKLMVAGLSRENLEAILRSNGPTERLFNRCSHNEGKALTRASMERSCGLLRRRSRGKNC